MWVAVLCLLGAGAGWRSFASWIRACSGCRSPPSFFVAAAALNWREGASLLGRRGMPRRRAALLVLMALGVAVLANAVARYNARWDLTEQRATASPQTVKLVSPAPVEAIGFFRPTRPASARPRICSNGTPRPPGVSSPTAWRTDRSPGLARRYGVESRHAVIQSGDKSEKVLDAERIG
jgi:hypothetical protein